MGTDNQTASSSAVSSPLTPTRIGLVAAATALAGSTFTTSLNATLWIAVIGLVLVFLHTALLIKS